MIADRMIPYWKLTQIHAAGYAISVPLLFAGTGIAVAHFLLRRARHRPEPGDSRRDEPGDGPGGTGGRVLVPRRLPARRRQAGLAHAADHRRTDCRRGLLRSGAAGGGRSVTV